MQKNVGILIFNEVEVLDFAGPFEVFSITEDENYSKPFKCFLIAETDEVVHARNSMLVKPNFTIYNCPNMDVLIIPGGYGAEKIEINNKVLINWLADKKHKVNIIGSVCTGAFLLAESKIITNEEVTTHWMDIDELQMKYPGLRVLRNIKYKDNNNVITSGGISAGIEMSLHLVERFMGIEIAEKTAKRMEYNWLKT
jgi:transcriptional regulator GlxA family with amidase domain